MPHFNIEYSANLDRVVDMGALCRCVRDTLLETGLFETGAVRVRAFRAEAYAVADGLPENAFIDMSLRIGTGRSQEEKRHAGEQAFAAVAGQLSGLSETPHFALSLEIREIDPALVWRRNTMHARLRPTSAG